MTTMNKAASERLFLDARTSRPAHMAPAVAELSATPVRKFRFASIDGLRGLAALMVVYLHCWTAFNHPSWPSLRIGHVSKSIGVLFAHGYGGVDLFFVLSGFCLAYPIISKPTRPTDWKRYAVARVRRIVPPYWGAMFLFGFLSLVFTRLDWLKYVRHVLEWPGTGEYIKGLFFLQRVLAATFWTLVIEWRWYFVFPLCIGMWRRTGAWPLLAATIAISVLSWLGNGPLHMAWLVSKGAGLPKYMPLFGLGIVAAEVAAANESPLSDAIARWSRWGLLVALVIVFIPKRNEEGNALVRFSTWGPLAFFAVVGAVRDPVMSRVLSWRPLVWIGTFSYSLYLVHWPFAMMCGALLTPHLHSRYSVFAFQVILVPAALVLVSYLFFLVAERPFLSSKSPTEREAKIASVPTHA